MTTQRLSSALGEARQPIPPSLWINPHVLAVLLEGAGGGWRFWAHLLKESFSESACGTGKAAPPYLPSGAELYNGQARPGWIKSRVGSWSPLIE